VNRETLLNEVLAHAPSDDVEASHKATIVAFLRDGPTDPFSRSTLEGHVTGSAVCVSENGGAMLLLWHEKLSRWLQPGGHCEPDIDEDTTETAWRELLEETETARGDWTISPDIFDLDAHVIPARGDVPEHVHHDIRYKFVATRPLAGPFRWVSLTEVAALLDESLARLAKKLTP
jgi:8-oxo-dGTP pyrophosphatase MutT (NUDIX family)